MVYILFIIIAYLLGSIPMGLILTRLAGRGDLRKIGSGNIGAANAMRAGGLHLAIATWLGDMLKTIIAVLCGYYVGDAVFAAWCGFAAVVGHCYPVWLGFRGGKGVSSLFGILLAMTQLGFVLCGIEWLIVALSFGFSSLGGLVVFCVFAFVGFAINTGVGCAFAAVSVLCIWRHRENIIRLLHGQERKLNWKWKK